MGLHLMERVMSTRQEGVGSRGYVWAEDRIGERSLYHGRALRIELAWLLQPTTSGVLL